MCAGHGLLLAALCLVGCAGASGDTAAPGPPAASAGARAAAPADPQPVAALPQPRAVGPGPGPFGARLLRPTALRARPAGPVLARLSTRTEFGSIQILAVAQRRPRWLAVRTPLLANGRIGWIPAASAELLRETWRVDVDVSARRMLVRHLGRRAFAVRVATGAPATPTPTGRFAITDRLRTTPGSPYGCCVLALTGHQPDVPQGWGGGDRIAIHGTPQETTVGLALSHGCLRASAADMHRLLAALPLGTPVRIHA